MKKRELIILVLTIILILGAFLRLYGITEESLWLDEASSIKYAELGPIEGAKEVPYKEHPPLYNIVLGTWVQLFGIGEYPARLLSAIFGIASIYLTFLVGRKLFKEKVGIITAILMAISVFNISQSQEVRSYSMLMFLTLLSIYFYLNFEKKQSMKNITFYVISTTLLLYTHVFGIFILIAQNTHKFLSKKKIKSWTKIQIAILILFLPWLKKLISSILTKLSGNAPSSWIPSPTLELFKETMQTFSNNMILFAIFITIIILVTFFNKKTKSEKQITFIWIWLVTALILPFLISYITPIYVIRYVIIALPAFYILTAWSISKIKYSKLQYLILLAIIILSITPLQVYYEETEKEQWREVSQKIKEEIKENEIILLTAAYTEEPFNYYYTGNFYEGGKGINTPEEAKEIIQDEEGIWYIRSHHQFTDPQNKVFTYLQTEYRMELWQQFRGISLFYFTKFK